MNDEKETKTFTDAKSKEHFTRPRSYDVKHVALDLRFDFDKKAVKGTATTTLTPIGRALREVELDCADTRVVKVFDEKKRELKWELVDETLAVDLGRSVKPGQEVAFTIRYEARPTCGLYFVGPTKEYPKTPHQIWSQGAMEDNHHWFPCYDSPNEKMTQDVVMTVPEKYLAISNGGLVDVKRDAKRRTKRYHWRQEQPHVTYLLTIVVGEFDVVEHRHKDIPVVYYIPKGRRDEAMSWLGDTPKMIAFFEKATGYDYPYAKYGQVIISDFMWGGMENTTITTLTDMALVEKRARLDVEGDQRVAIAGLEQALKRDIEYAPAHVNIAIAYSKLGNYELALVSLENAERFGAAPFDVTSNRGLVLVALGRYAEAVEAFGQALDERPGHLAVRFERALALAKDGRLHEAIIELQRLTTMQPEFAEVYREKARLLAQIGQAQRSLAQYAEYLCHVPKDAEAWNEMGNVRFALGHYERAETCFRNAIKYRRDYYTAYRNLAATLERLGRDSEAKRMLRKAERYAPQDEAAE